jgi:phosphoserine phosphatase RsbU/P
MDSFFDTVNIYMLPPFLSLVMGVVLAVVSIVRGKLKQENILFALLVLGWTLLSPVFLCHHIFRGNEELLLTIERRVHFFYVFLPPLNLLFFYKITGMRSRFILPAAFLLSFLLSLSTFTDYYFYGFYVYRWGYIAKGGIAFQIIELFGSCLEVYLIIFFIRKIRTEKNQILRLKLKYILLSVILMGFLTMTNIPALNGIDVYPLSNMMFIPLAFLGYGVLSYRLMDIRSVLHVTSMWAVISCLILIPNALLFFALYPVMITLSSGALFVIGLIWFYINYLYLVKVQPLIDQYFNKRKFNLYKIEASFIDNISYLKTTNELVGQFIDVITKALSFKKAELVLCHAEEFRVDNAGSMTCDMDEEIKEWFAQTNHLVDRDLVLSKERYEEYRKGLLDLFGRFNAQYLVPVLHMGNLVALLALPEKQNLRQLKHYEVVFINNIRSAFSIAMENAVMYSNLNNLKDNLEQIVIERTSELTRTRDLLLQDIELARKIQVALLPQNLPCMDNAEIHYKYVPMMGVGGDFIDVLIPGREGQNPGGGDAVCFFICDVSGHGVSAALTAAMVKMSLVAWEANAGYPARLLTNISASLKGKTGGNFITAASCHVNLKTGKLICANAGHPPLIIIRSNGTTEFLNAKGRLISDYIPTNCEDIELDLHDNDIVVLYTDGIIEEHNNEEMYGENRFLNILKSNRKSPVDTLCNAVYNSLIEFKGNAMLDDDFTILAMRYVAQR